MSQPPENLGPDSAPRDAEAVPSAPTNPTPGRHFRNVALVGFMGVGKSTVGNFLADLLGFELIDTDKLIEAREAKRISEIFAQQGEGHFRQLESELVRELASSQRKVISTGGGTIMNPKNLESLREHALIACLWASPETIYDRVRNQTHRPLLQGPDPLSRIRQLMSERAPTYRSAADIMVGVDFRHAPEVARHIAKSFQDVSRQRGSRS